MSKALNGRAGAAWISAVSVLLAADSAFASQGPGVIAGGAGPATQIGMAIAVYGGSAVLIAAGMIGAVRRRGP